MNEPRMTTSNIREMLGAVQADKEARQVFLSMPREEQLLAILGMIAFLSSQIAGLQKDAIDYRHKREEIEDGHSQEVMNTTQKIVKAISEAKASEFNFWLWFRDKVLPAVATAITLAVLYLAFGGR